MTPADGIYKSKNGTDVKVERHPIPEDTHGRMEVWLTYGHGGRAETPGRRAYYPDWPAAANALALAFSNLLDDRDATLGIPFKQSMRRGQ